MIISGVNTNQSLMPRSTEEKGVIPYDSDFSRIEELIKGHTFSREEISHLIDILDSRVDNEWEKQKSSTDAGLGTRLLSGTHEIQSIPSDRKQRDIDRSAVGTYGEELDVPIGVSASPIDIARSYMAGRTVEGGHDFKKTKSIVERDQPSIEFARKPLLPPPSSKPSVCWPGSVVHDRHGYATPQSQMGRLLLHDFPRTPYSRTILSKSKTKLQAESRYADTSTPFGQSGKSIYGQVKSRGDTIDGYGSVGPIRRIQNKFSSEVRPRGSIFSPPKEPSELVKPAPGGFLLSTAKTMELGETSDASKYWPGENILVSSDRGISNLNSSSSQAVRKILEHLDRNKPTPKEKEAELKLATAWRKSSPGASDTSHDQNVSSVHVKELSSQEDVDMSIANISVEFNKRSSTSNLCMKLQDKGMNEAEGAVNSNTKAFGSVFTGPDVILGGIAVPTFGLKNSFATNTHGHMEKRSLFSRPHLSNGQDVKMVDGTTCSESLPNNGKKPSLPSICINKPDLRALSSENGLGFTFPISADSGFLSEPPTPSVTPLSSASVVSVIPSYTFGTKRSVRPLVFSFPSTSSTSTQSDSDLKFSFGSDKTRLSFSSFGADAICY
ncbi:hypothetical protein OROGR_018440 [Orobanche gracilis]